MAKGQKRTSKEPRKLKSADKKDRPKYLRPAELVKSASPSGQRSGPKR